MSEGHEERTKTIVKSCEIVVKCCQMFHWLHVLQDLERRPVVSLTSRNSISQSVDSDRGHGGHGTNILTHDKPHNSRAFEDVEVCRSMSKYVEVCSFEDRMDRYGQGTLRISPEDVRKQTTVLRQIMNAISIFNEKQSCFLFLVSLCFLMFPYVSLHRELNLPNHQIRGEI